jgi:hypothetical protein
MIIIPMAGLSRRFTEAGYSEPKYRLDLHGRSVFSHAVASFSAYFEREEFLFVALDDGEIRAFIDAEVEILGLRRWSLILLPNPTLGQADTVAQCVKAHPAARDNTITIFNIDTFRPGFSFPKQAWFDSADGYLEVMRATDPAFSFVRSDPRYTDNRVAETAEKIVISDLASTGLYHFRSGDLFLDAFELEKAAPQAAELYIAPLYNHLIRAGSKIHYEIIDQDAVIFCGIPSQFEALRHRTDLA